MTDRSHDLARRLAFWALTDKKDEPSYTDPFVKKFADDSRDRVSRLLEVDNEIEALLEEKCRLGQDLFKEYYNQLQGASEEAATHVAGDQEPITDLEFWSRMSYLDSKLYSQLEPRFEELEKFVISRKINQKTEQRSVSQNLIASLLKQKKEKNVGNKTDDSTPTS